MIASIALYHLCFRPFTSLLLSVARQTMYEIFKSGYSRIPVYEKSKNDIVGLILAKDLIFVDPEVGRSTQCSATYDDFPVHVCLLRSMFDLMP